MKPSLPRADLFLLALNFSAASAPAQTTAGSMNGTVTDPDGASVANASVVVKNNASVIERNSTTDDKGSFIFPTLERGTYTVAVEAAGFKKSVAQDVVVETAAGAGVYQP